MLLKKRQFIFTLTCVKFDQIPHLLLDKIIFQEKYFKQFFN